MTKRLKIILMCIVAFFVLVGFERNIECGFAKYNQFIPEKTSFNLHSKNIESYIYHSMRSRFIIADDSMIGCNPNIITRPSTLRIYFRPADWLYEIKNFLK